MHRQRERVSCILLSNQIIINRDTSEQSEYIDCTEVKCYLCMRDGIESDISGDFGSAFAGSESLF